jgi:hypothetical protein
MPVVNVKSNLIPRSLGGPGWPDPQAVGGVLKVQTGTVANLSTDSNLSKYRLGDIPSDAYLDPSMNFFVTNWGFAQVNIGTESAPTALGTVAKAAGANFLPHVFGDSKTGKELWEALGLAANPGGFITLFAHATANATGAGSMLFRLAYLHRT